MAKKNVKANTKAIENAEAIVEEVTPAVEAPTEVGPKDMLLFVASRNSNKSLAWYNITVEPGEATEKVKGCAIELPTKVAEIIGTNKFVSYIDRDIIARCVEENKAVRGTASTVSDVYNRYIKVTDTVGERVPVAIGVFKAVLESIADGNNNGEWARPEPEKAEEEAPAEVEAAVEA
jgi:hypothetical protein